MKIPSDNECGNENDKKTAFLFILKNHKHEIRKYERRSTEFVCKNIELFLSTLQTNPEITLPFLLLQHREIDSAFCNILPRFIVLFREMPHTFTKIFKHWIVKYPFVVLNCIQECGFDFFFNNLDIESTSNMFIKLFFFREREFVSFVTLLKNTKFFSKIFAKLHQNVHYDKSTYDDGQEYDYKDIRVKLGSKLDKTENVNKKTKKEKIEVREVKNTSIGMLGVVKEFKKISISKIDENEYLEKNYAMMHNQSEIEKNQKRIRYNILEVLQTFLERHNDEYIIHKIMKHSPILLNLFINDTGVHVSELNLLHTILRTITNKEENGVIVSHIFRKVNNFKFLFQSLDDIESENYGKSMDLENSFESESDKIDDLKETDEKKEIIDFTKEEPVVDSDIKKEEDIIQSINDESVKNESNNKISGNKKEVSAKKPSENDSIFINRIFNNSYFVANIKIEFHKNQNRKKEFTKMVEKQLIKLHESTHSLGLMLKLDFLCFCSRFVKIREVLKKQLFHIFFIDIFYKESNSFLNASFITLIQNCLKDYDFLYDMFKTTNLLKMILKAGKEQLLSYYERYPIKKAYFTFNTELANIFLTLKDNLNKLMTNYELSFSNKNRNVGELSVINNKREKFISPLEIPTTTINYQSKTFYINQLLILLNNFFESNEWILIYDGVFSVEIAKKYLSYTDKRGIIDHAENDLPESMWRCFFSNLTCEMPFSDIFSENGI